MLQTGSLQGNRAKIPQKEESEPKAPGYDIETFNFAGHEGKAVSVADERATFQKSPSKGQIHPQGVNNRYGVLVESVDLKRSQTSAAISINAFEPLMAEMRRAEGLTSVKRSQEFTEPPSFSKVENGRQSLQDISVITPADMSRILPKEEELGSAGGAGEGSVVLEGPKRGVLASKDGRGTREAGNGGISSKKGLFGVSQDGGTLGVGSVQGCTGDRKEISGGTNCRIEPIICNKTAQNGIKVISSVPASNDQKTLQKSSKVIRVSQFNRPEISKLQIRGPGASKDTIQAKIRGSFFGKQTINLQLRKSPERQGVRKIQIRGSPERGEIRMVPITATPIQNEFPKIPVPVPKDKRLEPVVAPEPLPAPVKKADKTKIAVFEPENEKIDEKEEFEESPKKVKKLEREVNELPERQTDDPKTHHVVSKQLSKPPKPEKPKNVVITQTSLETQKSGMTGATNLDATPHNDFYIVPQPLAGSRTILGHINPITMKFIPLVNQAGQPVHTPPQLSKLLSKGVILAYLPNGNFEKMVIFEASENELNRKKWLIENQMVLGIIHMGMMRFIPTMVPGFGFTNWISYFRNSRVLYVKSTTEEPEEGLERFIVDEDLDYELPDSLKLKKKVLGHIDLISQMFVPKKEIDGLFKRFNARDLNGVFLCHLDALNPEIAIVLDQAISDSELDLALQERVKVFGDIDVGSGRFIVTFHPLAETFRPNFDLLEKKDVLGFIDPFTGVFVDKRSTGDGNSPFKFEYIPRKMVLAHIDEKMPEIGYLLVPDPKDAYIQRRLTQIRGLLGFVDLDSSRFIPETESCKEDSKLLKKLIKKRAILGYIDPTYLIFVKENLPEPRPGEFNHRRLGEDPNLKVLLGFIDPNHPTIAQVINPSTKDYEIDCELVKRRIFSGSISPVDLKFVPDCLKKGEGEHIFDACLREKLNTMEYEIKQPALYRAAEGGDADGEVRLRFKKLSKAIKYCAAGDEPEEAVEGLSGTGRKVGGVGGSGAGEEMLDQLGLPELRVVTKKSLSQITEGSYEFSALDESVKNAEVDNLDHVNVESSGEVERARVGDEDVVGDKREQSKEIVEEVVEEVEAGGGDTCLSPRVEDSLEIGTRRIPKDHQEQPEQPKILETQENHQEEPKIEEIQEIEENQENSKTTKIIDQKPEKVVKEDPITSQRPTTIAPIYKPPIVPPLQLPGHPSYQSNRVSLSNSLRASIMSSRGTPIAIRGSKVVEGRKIVIDSRSNDSSKNNSQRHCHAYTTNQSVVEEKDGEDERIVPGPEVVGGNQPRKSLIGAKNGLGNSRGYFGSRRFSVRDEKVFVKRKSVGGASRTILAGSGANSGRKSHNVPNHKFVDFEQNNGVSGDREVVLGTNSKKQDSYEVRKISQPKKIVKSINTLQKSTKSSLRQSRATFKASHPQTPLPEAVDTPQPPKPRQIQETRKSQKRLSEAPKKTKVEQRNSRSITHIGQKVSIPLKKKRKKIIGQNLQKENGARSAIPNRSKKSMTTKNSKVGTPQKLTPRRFSAGKKHRFHSKRSEKSLLTPLVDCSGSKYSGTGHRTSTSRYSNPWNCQNTATSKKINHFRADSGRASQKSLSRTGSHLTAEKREKFRKSIRNGPSGQIHCPSHRSQKSHQTHKLSSERRVTSRSTYTPATWKTPGAKTPRMSTTLGSKSNRNLSHKNRLTKTQKKVPGRKKKRVRIKSARVEPLEERSDLNRRVSGHKVGQALRRTPTKPGWNRAAGAQKAPGSKLKIDKELLGDQNSSNLLKFISREIRDSKSKLERFVEEVENRTKKRKTTGYKVTAKRTPGAAVKKKRPSGRNGKKKRKKGKMTKLSKYELVRGERRGEMASEGVLGGSGELCDPNNNILFEKAPETDNSEMLKIEDLEACREIEEVRVASPALSNKNNFYYNKLKTLVENYGSNNAKTQKSPINRPEKHPQAYPQHPHHAHNPQNHAPAPYRLQSMSPTPPPNQPQNGHLPLSVAQNWQNRSLLSYQAQATPYRNHPEVIPEVDSNNTTQLENIAPCNSKATEMTDEELKSISIQQHEEYVHSFKQLEDEMKMVEEGLLKGERAPRKSNPRGHKKSKTLAVIRRSVDRLDFKNGLKQQN